MGAKNLAADKAYSKVVIESLRTKMDWRRLFIADNLSPAEVVGLALNPQHTNICQPNHPFFAQDLNTSAMMVAESDRFIRYPIMSILNPNKVSEIDEREHTLYKRNFSSSLEKTEILDDVRQALKSINATESIQSECVVAADEFFTNAVYNAPFVTDENTNGGVSRTSASPQMDSGKYGQLFVGADQARLVIGCSDPYGALNFEKLITRIKRCYDEGVAAVMNLDTSGGAGIGLFTVFNTASSMYFVVQPGVNTTVICTLPLKIKSRTRVDLPKNLHYLKK